MNPLVPMKGKLIESQGLIIDVLMGLFMWSSIFLIMFVDAWAWVFQKVYFGFYKIPQINRSDYLVFDRYKLGKLNPFQKAACTYCAYANGVIAWIKDLIMQIEIYSCAIKHKTLPVAGQREPQREDYYPYEQFA